jgi:hypothetical protein
MGVSLSCFCPSTRALCSTQPSLYAACSRPRENLGWNAKALIKDLETRSKVAAVSTPKKNKRAAEPQTESESAQPAKQPKTVKVAASPVEQAPEVPELEGAGNDAGKSEYELARERTIARNHEMLKALGLLQTKEEIRRSVQAESAASHRSAAPRKKYDGPRRKSGRQPRATGEATGGTDEQDDDESWRPVYKPRTFFYNDGRDYGENVPLSEWKMPIVRDAQGHELRRRLSCHICTQCVASWRGAFSLPLGCATCPLIWCSRCLSNIFNFDGDKANGLDIGEVIKRANSAGTWSCFKCTGRCACQSTDSNMRGLTVIEKHKKWGWVGVTGNRDASCSKPKHMAIADAGVAASTSGN